MRAFYGMANQLTPFNENLSQALSPLRPLLKKNAEFSVDDERKQAFEKARQIMSLDKTLAFHCQGKPLHLFTDASNIHGLGCVLQQLQNDGAWRPIQVASRSLLDAQTRYHPIELELQCVAWATRKCRTILIGNRFECYTDHQPLINIWNKKRLDEMANSRILKCLMKLMDYYFKMEWVPGVENIFADALSRKPVMKPEELDVQESDEIFHHVASLINASAQEAQCPFRLEKVKDVAQSDLEYQLLKQQILSGFPSAKNKLSEMLHAFWQVRHDLSVSDDGFILFGTRLFIPKDLRKQVLEDLHSSHRGIEGTQARARLVVYWPSIDRQIAQEGQTCQKGTKKIDRRMRKSQSNTYPFLPEHLKLCQLTGSN